MKAKGNKKTSIFLLLWSVTILSVLLSACQSQGVPSSLSNSGKVALQIQKALAENSSASDTDEEKSITTFPSRPLYKAGELVDYTAQSGDILPTLAKRFNTSVEEIQEANPIIPESATTMPPGMPMKIPVYYLPLWGSPYKILPDSLFVDGPSQIGFDTSAFVADYPGWLKNYKTFAADRNFSGAEIVEYISTKWSVSPRLLLALLEYQTHALSDPVPSDDDMDFPLGNQDWHYKGLFSQLVWAANLLNDGYYSYRKGILLSIVHQDGRLERFDPWQNAATASLHNYFNTVYDCSDYEFAIAPEGFAQTYNELFGDPWENMQPHIPGSLLQPEFILLFEPGDVWAYTGAPHTGWGKGRPRAAVDFAPPSKTSGCVHSNVWVTAVASGLVVRSEPGELMIDMDGDGDERTGWNIFYLHISTEGRPPIGTYLEQGDPIGHPSCEGGHSTGTHIHLARKYNGEWMPADYVIPFNMEGWIPHDGSQPYLGTMTRNSQVVIACTCSNSTSFIQSDRQPVADH